MKIQEHSLDSIKWNNIKILIDECYPKAPRDVFEKLIKGIIKQRRIWCAYNEGKLVGLIMLSPHSKGAHIENLSVEKQYRKKGIGRALVQRLIQDTRSGGQVMISLTTRIPSFFEYNGFIKCGELQDGSVCMVFVSCGKESKPYRNSDDRSGI